MKAIALFLTVGALLGYGLADVSQPISTKSPVNLADQSSARVSVGR